MEINNPITIDIKVVKESTTRDGIYSSCFITVDYIPTNPSMFIVKSLQELIDLGYSPESNVCDFTDVYFSQTNKPPHLVIMQKEPTETFVETYAKNRTNDFLYIAIESKDIDVIDEFSEMIEMQSKLFFTSVGHPLSVAKLLKRKNTVVISGYKGEPPSEYSYLLNEDLLSYILLSTSGSKIIIGGTEYE